MSARGVNELYYKLNGLEKRIIAIESKLAAIRMKELRELK